MEKILEKINSLKDVLENTESLSEVQFESKKGLSANDFADIEEQFSVTIQNEVKTFYSALDGFTLSWEYHSPELEKNNNFIEGNVRILSLYEVMSAFDGRQWLNELWQENTPAEDLPFLKRLKVFDYFGKDNVHCVCLEVSTSSILTTNLWLFRQGNKPIPLAIQLPDYIDKLVFTKGFWGWQYLYAKETLKSNEFETVKMEIDLVLRNYGKIFSDDVAKELRDLYQIKIK